MIFFILSYLGGAMTILATCIVTTTEMQKFFFPAEAYHQDYLTRNPGDPYIVYNDLPKIDDLKRLFPDRYRAAPALVGKGVQG